MIEFTSDGYEKIIVSLVVLVALFVFAWTMACKDIEKYKRAIIRLEKRNFWLSTTDKNKESIHDKPRKTYMNKPVEQTNYDRSKSVTGIDIDRVHFKKNENIDKEV